MRIIQTYVSMTHHPRCHRGCDGDRPERQADNPEAALIGCKYATPSKRAGIAIVK